MGPNDIVELFFPIVAGGGTGLIDDDDLQIYSRAVLRVFLAAQTEVCPDVVGLGDLLPPLAEGTDLKTHSFAGDGHQASTALQASKRALDMTSAVLRRVFEYSPASRAERRIHQDGGGLNFCRENIVQELSVGIKSFKA